MHYWIFKCDNMLFKSLFEVFKGKVIWCLEFALKDFTKKSRGNRWNKNGKITVTATAGWWLHEFRFISVSIQK